MLFHCGLLDEQPNLSTTSKWINRYRWDHLPPDVRHELDVWLAMPGFSNRFHAHVFGRSVSMVTRYRALRPAVQADVARNWLSATRDDCVRLSVMRPGMGDIPILSQLRMLQDVKAGAVQRELAKEYRCHKATVTEIVVHGIRTARNWPSDMPLP